MSANEIKVVNKKPLDSQEAYREKAVREFQQEGGEEFSFAKMFNDQLALLQPAKSPEPVQTKFVEEETYEIKEVKIVSASPTQENKEVKTEKNILTGEIRVIEKEDDFAEQYLKLDAKNLTEEDIKAIQSLNNPQALPLHLQQLNEFNAALAQKATGDISYKSLNVSSRLNQLFTEAYKKNKPVRIELDNKLSVIFKIDRDGKLSAQFLSADKAMESLIKDNLAQLRAKMDKEGLPYKDISYRGSSSNKQHQERNTNNEDSE